MKKSNVLSLLFVLLMLGCWASVLWIHGMAGVYAWAVLKFAVPAAGGIWAVLNLIGLGAKLVKRVRPKGLLLNAGVSAAMFSHFLLTINVIPLAYPTALAATKPGLSIKLPLQSVTVIGWGGDSARDNAPHAVWPSERWAYDLVMEPYNTGSRDPEDYGIWNQAVYAPLEAVVIAAYDEEADIPPGSEDINSMEGNYVYLNVPATGTYLLLNHLKQHSVAVSVGDQVHAGDLLGHVGNSGSTSEPHLHIHHQRQDPTRTWLPIMAEGLPLYFENAEGNSMPVKGEVIAPTLVHEPK